MLYTNIVPDNYCLKSHLLSTVEDCIDKSAENVPPHIRSVQRAWAGCSLPTLAAQGTNSQSLAQLLCPAPEPIIEFTGLLLLPLRVKERDLLFTEKKKQRLESQNQFSYTLCDKPHIKIFNRDFCRPTLYTLSFSRPRLPQRPLLT